MRYPDECRSKTDAVDAWISCFFLDKKPAGRSFDRNNLKLAATELKFRLSNIPSNSAEANQITKLLKFARDQLKEDPKPTSRTLKQWAGLGYRYLRTRARQVSRLFIRMVRRVRRSRHLQVLSPVIRKRFKYLFAGSLKGKITEDISYEELISLLPKFPNPTNLALVLKRAWYTEGDLTQVSKVLENYPDLVADLNEEDTHLKERILGDIRMMENPIKIPERSDTVAYLPEPGRIMYCVHSTPVFNSNGYSIRTAGVASGAAASGKDMVVVARSNYPWDSQSPELEQVRTVHNISGIDYVHLPGTSGIADPIDDYIISAADAFVREALLQRPSLIQAASNYQVGMAALLAARRLGVPFVYEVRGLWELTQLSYKPSWADSERFNLKVDLETYVCTNADRILAITEEVKQVLVERGVPADRISLLPNAADPERFWPLPKDKKLAEKIGLRDSACILGYAGSLVEYEGLDLLISATKKLRDQGLDVQLLFLGSGPGEQNLKKQVKTLELDEDVKFLGRQKPDDIAKYFSLFDIMPCPRVSTPVTEIVSPLKPLEAMASAKAVVLSDVGPHLTLSGENQERAAIFTAGDPNSLADVLANLIEDAELRANFGRQGRQWIKTARNWDVLGHKLGAQYQIAEDFHHSQIVTSKRLTELKVGLIADEFTTKTITPSFGEVRLLSRSNWPQQLAGLDLIFVESAWEANNGEWHHGVGHYSDEEFADLAELLEEARSKSITTIFWNKEDPVHTSRFLAAASACDYVFTTDANLVPKYLAAGRGSVISAAATAFYAEPSIHNPLPGEKPIEDTVCYAGSFYGDRYKRRSAELLAILDACVGQGLAIYDRQANISNSTYHFPAHLRKYVRGGVPYNEILDVYRSHLANINVNSVADSPSMYSRRAVEIAACGGVVLSGPGRGIADSFGDAIITTGDPELWESYLHRWAKYPVARSAEAWRQFRSTYRSHTTRTALTVMLRTAGINISPDPLPRWGAIVDPGQERIIDSVKLQSWPPVVITDGEEIDFAAADYWAKITDRVPRTWAEDQLWATQFGQWDRIIPKTIKEDEKVRALYSPGSETTTAGMVATALITDTDLATAVTKSGTNPIIAHTIGSPKLTANPTTAKSLIGRTLLVAGHDLKFAQSLISAAEQAGAEVILDNWSGHNIHDEEVSSQLLAKADIVLCEWGLGNLKWYSENISKSQRLVVRVHSQEIFLPYLADVKHENVSAYIFVGELIRQTAIASHAVPAEKTLVIPNVVDTVGLDLPKYDDAEFHLGFVGSVPKSKRLDRALDLLELLQKQDSRYRLIVKGKTSHDYPWMAKRPDELAWYQELDARIEKITETYPGSVVFDGHGSDMVEWYRKIGIAISTSDFESFHLTISDGAASGAKPVCLAWRGADAIYPADWLAVSVEEMAEMILNRPYTPEKYKEVAVELFDMDNTLQRLISTISG